MPTLTLSGRAPLLADASVRSWSPDRIDLSGLEWASPYDLVALLVIFGLRREAGEEPAIVLPSDPAVRARLRSAGLAESLPGSWGVEDREEAPLPLLPITRLAAAEDWDFLLTDLWGDIHATGVDGALLRPTFEILSELVDNAATHGHSPVGTFLTACYCPSQGDLPPGVWLAIADGGRGIPAHLRLNPKYRGVGADERLIQLARRPWVTGTRDRRGWGLVEVFEQASSLGASEMLIRSGAGEGHFLLRPGLAPHARYIRFSPRVPGTWIHLRLAAA
jgi:hypothetical protein